MNLYQTLNQDLREFRMKTLLENEKTEVEQPIVNETEMSEDEIARQLVSLSDALETASDDEIPAIQEEINELKAKLDEIDANREFTPSDDDVVIEDSEDEETDAPTEEVSEETGEDTSEEPVEETVCLSVDELKDVISKLCDTDKEILKDFLNNKEEEEDTSADEVTNEVIDDAEEEKLKQAPPSIDVVQDGEEFHECEISDFKVVRRAPSSNAYMIEAQTKEGIKFITGKNFDEEKKTLDEAEISDNKMEATNRFKDLLANK